MKQFLTAIFLLLRATCMSQEEFSFSDSAVLSRLLRDVHILASDSFAGRKSGTAGELKAGSYIIGAFKEAGVTPPGSSDSSYLQPFPIGWVTVPRDSNSLIIEGYKGSAYPQYDYSPTAYSSDGSIEGNSYILIDLARFRNPPQQMPGETGNAVSEEIRIAFQKGISAVILYNEWSLNRSDRNSLYNWRKVKPLKGLVISVNPDIASYLQKHPGVNISASTLIRRTATTCHNIIGLIDNGAPYTIIIGAHYDHLGISRRGLVFKGADDNASGTAMMMELARYLKRSGGKTYNYLFAAFSGEEEGLDGSWFFVRNPATGLNTINFMVNLDMVGRLGCEGNVVTVFGTGTSPLWHSIYKQTPHPGFRLCKMHGVHDFTDHQGFYRQGIPIISITTGFHYEYHTTRDDPETINYRGMVYLTRYLEELLHQTASAEKAVYHKTSGWYNLCTNLKIFLKGIDHILTVGMEK
jgi:aminopeptidase YwaD